MAEQFDKEQLKKAFLHGLTSNPRNFGKEEYFNYSPMGDMLRSSPLADYIRQGLPERLGDSRVGQALDELLFPGQPADNRWREGLRNLRTGGYASETLASRARVLAEDPSIVGETVRRGMVPAPDGLGEVPAGDSFRANASQLAGVTTADLATEGLRNIWWFLNAPQAVGSLATLAAVHQAGKTFMDDRHKEERGPLLRNRNLRLATAVPAVALASLGIGNVMRNPGYSAVLPHEVDKTKTVDPLGEAAARFFLGRTGELLPYDEFYKERPDVSKGEYDAYKAYLFGNASPIKATLDGIHGPEVTFMGKSVPLATGVLPVIAAALGSARGIRKAGNRLREEGRLANTANLKDSEVESRKVLNKLMYDSSSQMDDETRQAAIEGAREDLDRDRRRYEDASKENSLELAKQALLFGSLYGGGAYVGGQTLEALRRAGKGQAPDPEEQKKIKERRERALQQGPGSAQSPADVMVVS